MKPTFYITLNIKTVNGFECYGRFSLGNDRDFAYALFQQLKGNDEVDEGSVLHMDFMETRNGLPVNLTVKSCTLQQLADNCRTITRETFKLFNLEEM
jgi:hypothetical protein